MKLFERAIRRAEIPVKMSEGFNPRLKISYPSALTVGIEGTDEKLELELYGDMQESECKSRLEKQLPESIKVASAKQVFTKQKSSVKDVTYKVKLKEGEAPDVEKIDELLSRDVMYVERKDKKQPFNIRPSINSISLDLGFIELNLKMTPKGMARPEEVLLLLGLKYGEDYGLSEIVRTKVNLSSTKKAAC